MSLKALREKRQEIAVKIRELADRQANWTTEDRTSWETVNQAFDAADAEVQQAKKEQEAAAAVAERLAHIASLESTPTQTVVPEQVMLRGKSINQQRELAFQGWALCQNGYQDEVTEEHRQAARNTGTSLVNREFAWKLGGAGRMQRGRDMAATEMRAAMGVSLDVLGGYTVPEGFVANLEYALRAYGGVRNRAEILRTETAQPLPWPSIADTTPGSTDPVYGGALINYGELLGENVATSLLGTPPVMGATIFGAQKFSSKLIQISTELLRDSAFNLASVIGKIIGERLGRITAQKWAVGDGNGIVPRGIVTAAYTSSTLSGFVTASSAGITFDDMINFIFALDPAYRTAPGACFLLHDKLIGALRLLKDGQGRYLWSGGSVQTGMEPTIWGYPYETVMEMPYDTSGHTLDATQTSGTATATQTALILFGDISKYKIREVATIRMKRLVERFAEYDQDGFIGYMECDGDLIDAGTHPVIGLQLHS